MNTKSFVKAILCHAETFPDKIAVGFKAEKLTYALLAEYVKKAAAYLKQEYHIASGDHAMLSAVSKPEYVVFLLAIQYLGAISVSCDKTFLPETIAELYHFTDSVLLISDSKITDETICRVSLRESYRKIIAENFSEMPEYRLPDADSPAEILFTTGTTGKAKAAILSHRNIMSITENMLSELGINAEDIVLIPLPLCHSLGIRSLRAVLTAGGTVILQNGFTFPKELTDNLQKERCTGFVCVPASIEKIYQQLGTAFGENFRKLRYIEIGSGSLRAGMKQILINILPDTEIFNVWGSSETGGVIFLNCTKYPEKLSSLGLPVNTAEIKMMDENGNSTEKTGRLAIRGDMQMQGYYKNVEATEKTLVNGWLVTNDLISIDADGFIHMLGRADDIINVGGEKVSPVEVENIASEYPLFQECACLGIPDPEGILGQIPVLLYVSAETPDEKEIQKFFASRLEQYKIPQKFKKVSSLPRNRMQKLDRKALPTLWEQNDNGLLNPVMRAILNRKSIRNFLEKRIPKDILTMIVKAGIQAPSGHNLQTWHFTVITNHEKIQALKALMQKTSKAKNVYFYGMDQPDVFIIISNDRRNDNAIQDCSVAAENIMLAAASYGIGSVWINVLKHIGNEPEVRNMLTELGIPEKHDVWASIAMGYPDGEPNPIARKMNVVSWVE